MYGRDRVRDSYTLQDMYKEYVKEYPEGHIYYLDYTSYIDITTAFLKYLNEQIVYKSATVTLPFRLGRVSVAKYKPHYKSVKNMTINWTKSKELDKHVVNFNEHSNGYLYRFWWDRTSCQVEFKTMYRFIPVRSMKRTVAKLIKNKENDYFER